MTSRSLSFSSSPTRSFGIASLFAILGAAIVLVPACSDEPTPQPSGGCKAGDVEDTDDKDCKQRVCQNAAFVDQADDTEVPDDGNACTTDTCADGQAQHAPATGACDVGGVAGTCIDGACKVTCAMDADCNDNSSCTTDTCDTASLTCTFVDDPANYDDNNDCTIDSCTGGAETHENAATGTACGPTGMGTCDGKGGCIGCESDEMCPADEPCVDHYCDLATKLCQSMPKPDGDLIDDMAGDCKLPACAGGQLVTNPNDADLPDDSNECTVDTCNAGVPANDPAPAETTCTAGVCDGMAACVQCVTAANCMGDFSCVMNQCFDCNDAIKNGNESDIDCGGDCGAKCGDGKVCNMDGDCGSNVCDNNVCVSCGDGVKNGTESDIDCGGATCSKCNTGQACVVGSDCVQGVCNANKVCDPAKCNDTVKNGNETDIDCGGGTCMKCPAGKTCKVDSDCAGGTKCLAGVCG